MTAMGERGIESGRIIFNKQSEKDFERPGYRRWRAMESRGRHTGYSYRAS